MPLRPRDGAFSAVLAATATLLVACSAASPLKTPASPGSPVDAALANKVYLALNASPVYYFRHVDVRVDDGVANLSGYVWSTDALYAARRIAARVPGVTGVQTGNLELERNGRALGSAR